MNLKRSKKKNKKRKKYIKETKEQNKQTETKNKKKFHELDGPHPSQSKSVSLSSPWL